MTAMTFFHVVSSSTFESLAFGCGKDGGAQMIVVVHDSLRVGLLEDVKTANAHAKVTISLVLNLGALGSRTCTRPYVQGSTNSSGCRVQKRIFGR